MAHLLYLVKARSMKRKKARRAHQAQLLLLDQLDRACHSREVEAIPVDSAARVREDKVAARVSQCLAAPASRVVLVAEVPVAEHRVRRVVDPSILLLLNSHLANEDGRTVLTMVTRVNAFAAAALDLRNVQIARDRWERRLFSMDDRRLVLEAVNCVKVPWERRSKAPVR